MNNLDYSEVQFSAKNLDKRLNNLLNSLNEYFNMTTKCSFVFLAAYGIRKKFNISNYANQGQGLQFRYETDKEYNNLIDILLAKIVKDSGNKHRLNEVLNSKDLYEKYFDILLKYANVTGIELLENELISYKNRLSSDNKYNFIQDVLYLFKEFEEENIF